MAETGKKADPKVSVPPANDPLPDTPSTPEEERKEAKEAPQAEGSHHLVRTQWPASSFSVEGVPVITMEGTMLTKSQLAKVEKLAPEYGIKLNVEDVN